MIDEAFEKRERQAAKQLKKSRWWQSLIQKCTCHYCCRPLDATTATMDHVVPISRGGRSLESNVVPACKECNQKKKSGIPVEDLLDQLRREY